MAFQTLSPGTLLSPVPAVMVSCALPGKRPNVITVAWAGTVCSDPPMLSISVRKERFSHHILLESGEFVVNLVGREQLQAADYCGVPAQGMDCAPAIAQCPLYLACKTQQVIELGSHDLFIARIAGMGVREELLDEKGKIDLRRAGLTAYSHGVYYALGDATGFFGYSVAAPEVRKRRMRELK